MILLKRIKNGTIYTKYKLQLKLTVIRFGGCCAISSYLTDNIPKSCTNLGWSTYLFRHTGVDDGHASVVEDVTVDEVEFDAERGQDVVIVDVVVRNVVLSHTEVLIMMT